MESRPATAGAGGPYTHDLQAVSPELFQFAQEIDWLVQVHREGGAALGEALDGDLRSAEPAHGVLETDKLGEVPEGTDLELDPAGEEAIFLWL